VTLKPSDWERSLRDKVARARESDDVSEPVQRAQSVLKDWDEQIEASNSEGIHRVGQEGRKILAEIERRDWQERLGFSTWLFSQLLKYDALLEPGLVEMLRETLETCQRGRTDPDNISKDQLEEQLDRTFNEIFKDQKVAYPLLVMVYMSNDESADADIRELSDGLKAIDGLLADDKIEAAKRRAEQQRRRPAFHRVESKVAENIEFRELVKPESGGHVDTTSVNRN
jgi:hypothetical protein